MPISRANADYAELAAALGEQALDGYLTRTVARRSSRMHQ